MGALQEPHLIPVERALEIVLDNARTLPTENVDFQDAPGRVLAEDASLQTQAERINSIS